MKKLLFILLGLGIAACTATSQDDAKIRERMDEMVRYAQKGNFAAIMEMMPPDFFSAMAQKEGVSLAEFKAILAAKAKEAGEAMPQLEFTYDMGKAQRGTSTTGRNYIIIPTRIIMSDEKMQMEKQNHILAIAENGQWYLLRIETPANLEMIKTLYPDLKELPNMPSSSRIIPIEPK